MRQNNSRVIRGLVHDTEEAVASGNITRILELVSLAQQLPSEKWSHKSGISSLLGLFVPAYHRATQTWAERPCDVLLINYAFSFALGKRSYSVIRQLLESGLSPTKDQNWGFVANAVNIGDVDQLKIIVEEMKADVNAPNIMELPISHLDTAAQLGNLAVVRYLVHAGAVITACSVLEASRNGRVDVLRFLLESGGDPTAECLRVGSATLQYLARNRRSPNRDVVLEILNKYEA